MKYVLVSTVVNQCISNAIELIGTKEDCITEMFHMARNNGRDNIRSINEELVEDIKSGHSEYDSIDEMLDCLETDKCEELTITYDTYTLPETIHWEILEME